MSWGDVQFKTRPASNIVSSLRRLLAPTKIVSYVLMIYVGVAVPVMSFFMAWSEPPNSPQWQSGNLCDYLSYLLTARVGFVFYPLMIYSMVCFVLALLWRERFARRFIVRLGVYSGVVLGLHYCVLLNISTIEASDWWQVAGALPLTALFAAVAGVVGMFSAHGTIIAFAWLQRLIGAKVLWGTMAGIAIVLVLLTLVSGELDFVGAPLVPLFVVFFVSLFCGPFWFTAAYVYLSIDLTRRYWERGQFRIWHLMFVFTWLGGYLATTRAAVNLALAEYAKLPTEPPDDCYIATAAARGHQCAVGSRLVFLPDGKTMRVNRQLQVLKCAEIAIRTLCPYLHRAMRCVYDRIGPILARGIAHPLLADVVYLTLKPAQWLASSALRMLLGDIDAIVSQMYAERPTDKT